MEDNQILQELSLIDFPVNDNYYDDDDDDDDNENEEEYSLLKDLQTEKENLNLNQSKLNQGLHIDNIQRETSNLEIGNKEDRMDKEDELGSIEQDFQQTEEQAQIELNEMNLLNESIISAISSQPIINDKIPQIIATHLENQNTQSVNVETLQNKDTEVTVLNKSVTKSTTKIKRKEKPLMQTDLQMDDIPQEVTLTEINITNNGDETPVLRNINKTNEDNKNNNNNDDDATADVDDADDDDDDDINNKNNNNNNILYENLLGSDAEDISDTMDENNNNVGNYSGRSNGRPKIKNILKRNGSGSENKRIKVKLNKRSNVSFDMDDTPKSSNNVKSKKDTNVNSRKKGKNVVRKVLFNEKSVYGTLKFSKTGEPEEPTPSVVKETSVSKSAIITHKDNVKEKQDESTSIIKEPSVSKCIINGNEKDNKKTQTQKHKLSDTVQQSDVTNSNNQNKGKEVLKSKANLKPKPKSKATPKSKTQSKSVVDVKPNQKMEYPRKMTVKDEKSTKESDALLNDNDDNNNKSIKDKIDTYISKYVNGLSEKEVIESDSKYMEKYKVIDTDKHGSLVNKNNFYLIVNEMLNDCYAKHPKLRDVKNLKTWAIDKETKTILYEIVNSMVNNLVDTSIQTVELNPDLFLSDGSSGYKRITSKNLIVALKVLNQCQFPVIFNKYSKHFDMNEFNQYVHKKFKNEDHLKGYVSGQINSNNVVIFNGKEKKKGNINVDKKNEMSVDDYLEKNLPRTEKNKKKMKAAAAAASAAASAASAAASAASLKRKTRPDHDDTSKDGSEVDEKIEKNSKKLKKNEKKKT